MKAILLILILAAAPVHAQIPAHHHNHDTPSSGPAACGEMEVWDFAMGMCMPLPMSGMPVKMGMLTYNSFFTQTVQEGARGRNAFSVPNMVMFDIGSSLGDRHYLNLNFMGTLERWTFPKAGYPELFQIGEENEDHEPYLDAQHPHSSPIMGLTISDTFALGSGKDHLKIWFAPRGQATEGPVAFMHRSTGMVNPDAPLGHHVGQDAGHITSTVLGALIRLGDTTLEGSTFNGREPEPAKVDLPIGELDSYAARLTQIFSPQIYAMVSAAYVKSPEAHDADIEHVHRYSASIYTNHELAGGWRLHNTLIYGRIHNYDQVPALTSFAEEFWLSQGSKNIWSRIEHLQRTAGQLNLESDNPDDPLYISALTLGYTHDLGKWEGMQMSLGGSLSKGLLPTEFRPAYSADPVTAKIFLQIGGMKNWNL